MKKKNVKQLLSALLVIAMMATLLIVPAAAAGKTVVDVWDFGAEQLADTEQYQFVNHMTAENINPWVAENGTIVAEGFTVDGLTFTTGGKANHHRLYSTNTEILHVNAREGMDSDGKDPYVSAQKQYNGYFYSNSSGTSDVSLSLACESGDVITVVVSSNGGDSLINFEGPSGVEATCLYTLGSRKKGMTMTFYAKETGTYSLYSSNEKLTAARLYREHAKSVAISGTITEAEGMPAAYSLVFTNQRTGAETEISVENKAYSGTLLAPYSYDITLKGAEGFAVLSGGEVAVTSADDSVTNDVTIQAVDRVTVSGTITGLDKAVLAKMGQDLLFTPTGDGIVYVPAATVNDDGTYTAQVEKDMTTTISALHINDYEITTANVTDRVFTGDTTLDLTFAKKATYPITIQAEGIETAALADATFTFTKLDEAGETEDQYAVPFNPKSDTNLQGEIYNYVYTFTGTEGIALRDGIYDVAVTTTAGKQNVTSNLKVAGKAVTKTIKFTPAAAFVAPGNHSFVGTVKNTVPAVDGMRFAGFVGHSEKDTHGLMSTGGAPYTITLELKDVSNVIVAGCQHSKKDDAGAIIPPTATADGEAVEVVSDGATDPTYTISGVSGTLVITFTDKGSSYVHGITVESAVTPTIAAGTYDLTKGTITVDGLDFGTLTHHNRSRLSRQWRQQHQAEHGREGHHHPDHLLLWCRDWPDRDHHLRHGFRCGG